MNKKFIAILACLTASFATMGFAACQTNPPDSGDGDRPGIEQPDEPNQGGGDETNDNYALKIEGTSTSRTIDLEAEARISYTVTKNGATVTGEEIEITLDGSSVKCTAGEGSIRVQPVALGETTVTLSLKNHPEVAAKKVKYTVVNYFFSRDLIRGDVNFSDEANGSVLVRRSNDATSLVYKKASTQFKFSATLELPAGAKPDTTGESLGAASFYQAQNASMGDNALWFGAKSTATAGVYSIYQRNFYEGWGSPKDEKNIEGYENRDFGSGKIELPVEIVRKGAEYYYSVGGLHGAYTDTTAFAEATYPGIYAQHFSFTVKNFAVTTSDDDIDAAIEAYESKGYAAVSIKEKNTSYLVSGKTYAFTAKAYPTLGDNDGAIATSWSIDAEELNDKGDTAIDNDGNITVAQGANGYVTIICTSEDGKLVDKFRVQVFSEVKEYADDLFNYTGGVILREDGSVNFPESFATVDGVGDEGGYVLPDNRYYALSKQKYSGAFSVEFAFNNYKNVAGAGKLEVGLGDRQSKFFINKSQNIVEAFAFGTHSGGAGVGWYVAYLPSSINLNGYNTFKVAVNEKGQFEVYLSGQKLSFVAFGTNNTATLKRPYNCIMTENNVKIATNGASVDIAAMKIERGSLSITDTEYVMTPANYDKDGGTYTLQMPSGEWGAKDNFTSGFVYLGDGVEKLSGAYVVEFDALFNEAMKDGKLVLRIGNYEYMIENKYAASNTINGYIYANGFNGGNGTTVTNTSGRPLSAKVRLEVDANRGVKLYVNDVLVTTPHTPISAPAASFLDFYTFRSNKDEGDYSVTVSNLTISDYSAKTGIVTVDVAGGVTRAITDDESEKINLTVNIDGTATTEYTVEASVEGKAVSFDKDTMTVTGLAKGKAQITLIITPNDTSIEAKTVLINYEVTDFFFHKTMHRGDYTIATDADGNETGVSINAGNAGVVYRKASTTWLFTGTISFNDWSNGEAISLTSTRGTNPNDVAGNDLWFRICNGNEGNYSISAMEFYNGWGNFKYPMPEKSIAIPGEGNVRTVSFKLIRNGNDYYFVIGDYVEKCTVELAEATYPGIFTQNNPVTLTNMQIDMTAEGVAKAIEDLQALPVTSLKIVKDIEALTAGESHQFTATKNPSFVTEGFTWGVNTEKLTDGKSEVSIDQTGLLTTGENAEGTLIITVTSAKGVTDSIEIELTKEVIPTENELLTVHGATLSKDAAGNYTQVVFAEAMQNVDGIGNQYDYVENTTYSANLKNTVKSNFSIEFTVSDYKTDNREFPKLMVSLGGKSNQFYVVYRRGPQHDVHQIETWTESIDPNGNHRGADWVNAPLPAGFDINAAHTYKITVNTDGTYTMTVDGTPLVFKVGDEVRTPVRRKLDYSNERNVRFSTSGVSAKISDIKVVNGTETSYSALGNLYTENYNAILAENGFTVKTAKNDANDGWQNEKIEHGGNQVNYTGTVTANTQIEYKLAFSRKIEDSKFITSIGGKKVMINYKAAENFTVCVNGVGNDWQSHGTFPAVELEMYVKIVRANDKITVFIGATKDGMTEMHTWNGAGTDTDLHFYLFNLPSEMGATATVSELSVTEYNAQ